MLVTMKELLDDALSKHYGIIAPSIRNESCIRYAIQAAEELNSPLIINICYPTIGNPTKDFFNFFVETTKQYALRTRIPCAINLDHGSGFEQCAEAIHAGFTSVMIDSSVNSFEKNVSDTKEVVKMAHATGVSVEAELGHVGFAEKNANCIDENMSQLTSWSSMTDPIEAKRFVEFTGVDCLAVSIGNAHGPYAKNTVPHIDFERLQSIRDAIPNTPLVLHGGSGTGDENLTRACQMGICKINVGTELENAVMMAVVDQYSKTGKSRGVFDTMMAAYKEQIMRHIRLFGSENRI